MSTGTFGNYIKELLRFYNIRTKEDISQLSVLFMPKKGYLNPPTSMKQKTTVQAE